MSINPYNLVLRLVIEFYGYIVFGFTGFFVTESILRWPLAVFLPIAAGIVWGTFYVDKDPAGIGKAIVRVNGPQRLIIEFLFYAITVFLSFNYVSDLISYIYLYLILVHNIFSIDRLIWLVKSRSRSNMKSPYLSQ